MMKFVGTRVDTITIWRLDVCRFLRDEEKRRSEEMESIEKSKKSGLASLITLSCLGLLEWKCREEESSRASMRRQTRKGVPTLTFLKRRAGPRRQENLERCECLNTNNGILLVFVLYHRSFAAHRFGQPRGTQGKRNLGCAFCSQSLAICSDRPLGANTVTRIARLGEGYPLKKEAPAGR